jgi:hypothetical protein
LPLAKHLSEFTNIHAPIIFSFARVVDLREEELGDFVKAARGIHYLVILKLFKNAAHATKANP